MSERIHTQQLEKPADVFDERQREVVATGEFLRVYKEELQELFTALGHGEEWTQSPDVWLPMVREGWIGKEHGYSEDKEQFIPEQIEAASPILEKMGFTGELIPAPGHYRAMVILGGMMGALEKRVRWMEDYGIIADEVVILAGQRPVIEEREGTKEELLSGEGRRDISGDLWAQRALGGERQLYETDMALLAMMKYVPTRIKRIDLELLDATNLTEDEVHERIPQRIGDIPPRLAKDYRLESLISVNGEEKEQDVIILNGKPQIREGDPRPTTASTVIEWLERLAPKKNSEEEPIEIVVLSGNPHTLRTIEEVQRILDKHGRSDIRLVPAGTVQPNGTPIDIFYKALGEVGRMMDRDWTAQKAKNEQKS